MPGTLTLGSLFDGSGGFPLGGIMCGIRPLWASEIEPFPIMVTTKRLPFMKHIGDITDVHGGEIAPVDIITFGSPCQDMSIAGRRDGLGGSRSGLFYEAVRVIREMRKATDGRYPRYIVWENVTGAFSSNRGEDFRAVLEEIIRIKEAGADIPRYEKWPSAGQILADRFSAAWRVFDAQYWGVPQRRKRIYLVADLDGERAGKILFESEGLSRYSAEGFRAWQRAAGSAEDGAYETGCICLKGQGGKKTNKREDVSCTPGARKSHPPCILFDNHSQDCRYTGPVETAQAVVARYGTGGNNQSLVITEAAAYGIDRAAYNQGKNALFDFTVSKEIEPTMVAKGPGAVCQPVYSSSKASFFTDAAEDVANTLVATDYKDPPIINDHAYGFYPQMKAEGMAVTEEVSCTLVNGTNPGWQNGVTGPGYIVRRLTPTECARLQGFPDWWTEGLGIEDPTDEDIARWTGIFETYRRAAGGKTKPKSESQLRRWLKDPYTDSAAYKLWGNGVALPCVWFVLAGIVYYDQL